MSMERLWLLLSAERLLGGATEALLRETDSAYKDITDELYKEYKDAARPLDRVPDRLRRMAPSCDGARRSRSAQKMLDRILFVAFAERTALLPDKLLERAANARNEFRPEPYLEEFSRAFRRNQRWQRGPRHLGLQWRLVRARSGRRHRSCCRMHLTKQLAALGELGLPRAKSR